MGADLSTSFDNPKSIPYFLWDDPMTVAQLRDRLSSASRPERIRLIGRILRQARDTDVWSFIDLVDLLDNWSDISRHLGRRRAFWEYLISGWRKDGLLDG